MADLEIKLPGSTFIKILKSHGTDGRYLVLFVVLLNLSDKNNVVTFLDIRTSSGFPSDSHLGHQPNGPRLDWQSTRIFQCLIWVHLASLVWAIS